MNSKWDFEAEVTFLASSQGGRKGPALSGYRPQFHYPDAKASWVIQIEWIELPEVYPGQTVGAKCRLLNPWQHLNYITPNRMFELREGTRIAANGKVTKLLSIEKNALKQKQEIKANDEVVVQNYDGLPKN